MSVCQAFYISVYNSYIADAIALRFSVLREELSLKGPAMRSFPHAYPHSRHRSPLGNRGVSLRTCARCSRSSAERSDPRLPSHGECSPAVDVYETDDWLELTVDLPGVDAATVRVIAKGDSVLIAGEKAGAPGAARVELSSGRARLRTLRARRPTGSRLRHIEGARDAGTRRVAGVDPENRRATRTSDSDRGQWLRADGYARVHGIW